MAYKFAVVQKIRTFVLELIRELFLNSHNLLVISFSVINYVVRMRASREGRAHLFYIGVCHGSIKRTSSNGIYTSPMKRRKNRLTKAVGINCFCQSHQLFVSTLPDIMELQHCYLSICAVWFLVSTFFMASIIVPSSSMT